MITPEEVLRLAAWWERARVEPQFAYALRMELSNEAVREAVALENLRQWADASEDAKEWLAEREATRRATLEAVNELIARNEESAT